MNGSKVATPDRLPVPPVAGIGASAGGVEALQALFHALPIDTGLAFVVVLHLAPDQESQLDKVLANCTDMPVLRIDGELPLEPNRVYVITPDRQLDVRESHIASRPFDNPPELRSPIDGFFRSLATHHGDGFAIILSGSGSDGSVGVQAIKEAAGVVLAQDPAEAAFSSMPRAAIATGAVDLVLPVAALAARIAELAAGKRRARKQFDDASVAPLGDDDEVALLGILGLLHARTGHDFAHYKQATVLRRVMRRMQVARCESLESYQDVLRGQADEAQALFDDLLITVTSFFRDPAAWRALAQEVVPELFDARAIDEPVRAWVAGCATGEEAYSLVMLLIEEAERRERWPEVQVFATDLDDASLQRARLGRYPAAIAEDVGVERLERFFVKEDGYYRVTHALRERVLFTGHSLLKDPPFTRLDLITCRNLLIYLERPVQRQIFDIFRYALHPGGYLFLGSAETVDEEPFLVVDGPQRLFRADPAYRSPALPDMILGGPRRPIAALPFPPRADNVATPTSVSAELAPPSVLVDRRGRLVRSLEGAGRYLCTPDGPATVDLDALVRPELKSSLRHAMKNALQRNVPVMTGPVDVRIDDRLCEVSLWLRPRGEDPDTRRALVVFLENVADEQRQPTTAAVEDLDSRHREMSLREQLRLSESRLLESSEDNVAALEAVRASNEELQSVNEEYRSTAEELETSKEELQSINEELNSVNVELKHKLEEVSRGHDDLENLITSTDIGTLFLDRTLTIQRFTPTLKALFSIQSSDRGRSISDLTHQLDYTTLEDDARDVLADLSALEREARHHDGRRFAVRLRPYLTAEHRIEGVVLTFIDISEHRAADEALQASEARLNTLLDSIPDVPFSTGADGRLTWIGKRMLGPDGGDPSELVGQPVWQSLMHPDDREHAEANWVDARAAHRPFEMRHRSPAHDGEWRWVITRAQRAVGADHERPSEWVGTITDIDELTRAEVALREADRHRNRFLGLLGHELRNPLAAISNGLQLLGEQCGKGDGASDSGSDSASDALTALQRQSAHMSRLVDDLLDLTRISTGKVDLRVRRINLADCIDESLRVMRPRIEATGGRLSVRLPDAPLWIEADPERLVQVLGNLLDNAIKYSDASATIDLAVDLATHTTTDCDEREVVIRISDAGIGIATDVLPTLFDAFTQGSGVGEEARGGLGLGLALVRNLVELHGGRIEAQSDGPGEGSTFSVHLPICGQRSMTRPESVAESPPNEQKASSTLRKLLRVLVVDDSPDVANPFAALMRAVGHKVEVAYDGPSGLKTAIEYRPEVAFLDLGMPGMTGLELAKRLRREFTNEQLLLVAVTGYGQKEDIAAALEAGFDRHLLKPVRMVTVKALLEKSV